MNVKFIFLFLVINISVISAQNIDDFINTNDFKLAVEERQDDKNFIINDISLFQNYPNPFNTRTMIIYTIPVANNVKLALYDLSGKEVAFITDQYQIAGLHYAFVNAKNLTSGIYWYKLQLGKTVAIRKFVINR